MSEIAYEARPLRRRDIRAFAMRLRAALGFAEKIYIDAEELLDLALPRVAPEFGYGILPRSTMGSDHGRADPDNFFIWLRSDVHEGACHGRGRDRLTVIHEIAHVLLHTSDRILLRRGTGRPKAYCDPEWQANCFAGEFLMPHPLVRHLCGPEEVAATCAVSLAAARLQWDRFREDHLL